MEKQYSDRSSEPIERSWPLTGPTMYLDQATVAPKAGGGRCATCAPFLLYLFVANPLIYIYGERESSFPKLNKRHWQKWACNANTTFIDCVFEKRFSHRYIYIWIYMFIWTYLWSPLFQNMISKLAICITNSRFGLVLIDFWKGALHMHIYIYIYIYM